MDALIAKAENFAETDPSISLRTYLRVVENIYDRSVAAEDAETAYCFARRCVALGVRLRNHPEYETFGEQSEESEAQLRNMRKLCGRALSRLEALHEPLKRKLDQKEAVRKAAEEAVAATEPSAPPLDSSSEPHAKLSSTMTLKRTMADFEELGTVGEGTFGRVVRVRDRVSGDGEALVIKRITFENRREVFAAVREVDALRKLDSERVVRLRHMFVEGDEICLVMKYYECDLETFLFRHDEDREPLSNETMLQLATDIIMGMRDVHEAGLLHRDIKPSNVLLERADDGRWRAVIGDFGLSLDLLSSKSRHTKCGTLAYMAPEVMEGGVMSEASDVYSAGAVLYELAAFPYKATRLLIAERREHVLQELGEQSVGTGYAALVGAMTSLEPAARPSFASALEFLFDGLNNRALLE